MTERPSFHLTASASLADFARRGVPVVPYLRQMEALAEAWRENEARKGGVVWLTTLQIEYCELAGHPLRWS